MPHDRWSLMLRKEGSNQAMTSEDERFDALLNEATNLIETMVKAGAGERTVPTLRALIAMGHRAKNRALDTESSYWEGYNSAMNEVRDAALRAIETPSNG